MSADRTLADAIEVERLVAAGHPVRLAILRELAERGEVCGCGFAVMASVKQPTVSHHLRILREAGLVSCRRDGIYVHYRLDPDGLADLRGVVASLGDGLPDLEHPGAACCGPGTPVSHDERGR